LSAASPSSGRRPVRPPDARAVDEALLLLARSVQQFHTYPPGSPICQQAVDACVKAIVSLEARETVTFRVAPNALIVDEEPVGAGTLIEQELARRLHQASIAEVTIERSVSPRELARFCGDLVACGERSTPRAALIDLVMEHGVQRVSLRAAYRPEVLPVPAVAEPVQGMIDRERVRRDELFAPGGPVNHLYPPDKGWVRVDPSATLGTVSLIDLALLAENPAALARLLVRLTDGEAGEQEDALSRKYSEVATIFGALDPRLARVMFAKLARAVLDLDSDRRQTLLKRTILPGLLDGRLDGAVLKDFPDLELADSLCLLLDLEAAAPEVVTAALTRLELPAERQAAMLPLLEDRVQSKVNGGPPQENAVDSHAKRLIKIDRERTKSVVEFAAFDLALDGDARAHLAQLTGGIDLTETAAAQLDCLWHLIRLEPNPEAVDRFASRVLTLVEGVSKEDEWTSLTLWTHRLRELAETIADARPDVAEILRARLASLCTDQRAARLVTLSERDEAGKQLASEVIASLGSALAPALMTMVPTAAGRAAAHVLCDHAALFAPVLAAAAETAPAATQRVIARALGFAGHGYEAALGSLLRSHDEQTVREALRGLARIGTSQAASLVGSSIQGGSGWVVSAAEQTLWHFPKAEADRQVIVLLSRRDFIVRQPEAAGRLIDHAPKEHANTVAILEPLQALRYRIWNPSLARIGRKARAMLLAG
jgi:HEAT repeats